jgi:hypothetical protein
MAVPVAAGAAGASWTAIVAHQKLAPIFTTAHERESRTEQSTSSGDLYSSMPSAIEHIVDTYVGLNNRRALEAMLMHRQRLSVGLKGRGCHGSLASEKMDEDIAAIQAGINRLIASHPAAARAQ